MMPSTTGIGGGGSSCFFGASPAGMRISSVSGPFCTRPGSAFWEPESCPY